MLKNTEIDSVVLKSAVRGFLTRKKILSTLYPLSCIVRIQKFIRGAQVRLRLKKIQEAATKIQSFYKSKLAQGKYLQILSSTKSIQSAIKKFLLKTRQIRSSLSPFLNTEQALMKNCQLLEHSELFSIQKPGNEPEQEVFRALSTITESSASFSHSQLMTSGSLALQLKQVSPFHLEKFCFFSRPFELELLVDSNIVYEPFWSKQFEMLNKELVGKDEQIMDVALGNCHSMALTSRGRVFAWGWNDKYQCGSAGNKARIVDLPKSSKVVQISCGNDHSLLLTTNGEVLVIGDNTKGQLGLGHYSEQKTLSLLSIPPCKQVEAVGNQNMVVSESGDLYIWPFETLHGEKRSYPVKMIPDQVVFEVSVGFNFAVILTASGLLFSLGSNNKCGQLGQGDLVPRATPTLILSLKKQGEKISHVSCGHSHVLAKSTLGKLFSWGRGFEGQLGHNRNTDENSPKQVNLKNERLKPIQLAAGENYSIIMLENRKVLWTGKNSMISSAVFIETNINARIPELYKTPGEFAIVKIRSAWSRVLSVSLITVVDLRYLQSANMSKLQTGLNLMAGKWTSKVIEPPFIESISGYYAAGNSKKTGKKVGVRGKVGKIDEIKEKISEILKKPGDKWTMEDRFTMECVTKMNN